MHIVDYLSLSELPLECINECTVPGRASDPYVDKWLKKLDFTVDSENARSYIKAHGIEDTETMDDKALASYILWMACGSFKGQLDWQEQYPDEDPRDSDYGSDLINIDSY